MSDWQVGDLALCVNIGILVIGGVRSKDIGGGLAMCRQYTVSDVRVHPTYGFIDLVLSEAKPTPLSATGGFRSQRFVKVTPPAADEFDREVIEQMNKVSA